MKKLVYLAMIALAAFAVCPTAGAQAGDPAAYVELLRADFKSDKLAIVTETLGLSAQEADAFWPVYRLYEAEVTKIGDQRIALIKDFAANYSSMTEVKAKEIASRSFDIEKKMVGLKQNYFKKMEKAVSATTAMRFFQVEKQIQSLIDLQVAQELPLVPKMPATPAENR
jgi:hypothetical protein